MFEGKILIKEKGRVSFVDVSDVTHIVAEGYISTIHTQNRQITVSKLLKVFEDELSEYDFVRINRNVLVNAKYIEAIVGGETRKIYLRNKVELKVSRRKMYIVRRIFL